MINIYTILCLESIIFLLGILFLLRNEEVYSYRRKVSDYVFWGSKDWEEKLKIFESVSYNEMVFKIWRDVESFYPKEWKI
jgi:hypothetical protein